MSAPNLKEIEWAIQELEQEESSFPVYAKLANLYTVRNEMLGLSATQPQIAAYSEAASTVIAISCEPWKGRTQRKRGLSWTSSWKRSRWSTGGPTTAL